MVAPISPDPAMDRSRPGRKAGQWEPNRERLPEACDRAAGDPLGATHLRATTRAALLVCCLVLACGLLEISCFVEPVDRPASVTLWLDLGTLELPLEVLPGPREEDGLVHIDRVFAYIQVEVNGPGMAEPALVSWPEEGTRNPRQQVSLEFEVPAGLARQFTILAYVYQGGQVRIWRDDGTLVADLEGGRSSSLAASLLQVGRGAVSCELTGAGAASVTEAMAIDGDPEQGFDSGPGVAWPPVEVQESQFEITDLPVGRPLTFRLVQEGEDEALLPPLQIELSEPAETVPCQIAVP
ncbi:MAG: hypothetical protein JW797_07730 [Bradymonadales bacterium]|nr:hypothetical protein [Bradymonadales bacterium]